jgi:hypothetical protein
MHQSTFNDDAHSGIYSDNGQHHLMIRNNRFTNGSYGICLYGWNTESTFPDISYNLLEEPYYAGIFAEWLRSTVIHGNKIVSPVSNIAFIGIHLLLSSQTRSVSQAMTIRMNSYGRGLNLYDLYGIIASRALWPTT